MCLFTITILNRDIQKAPGKTVGQMSLHVRKEIIHSNEMNDQIFNVDMNAWDNVRNVIKPIPFHLFHAQRNSMRYNRRDHHSSIRKSKLYLNHNHNGVQMLLINHLSNLWCVIQKSNYEALSLAGYLIERFPSVTSPDYVWNNSSYDPYQKNIWYPSVCAMGVERCNIGWLKAADSPSHLGLMR
jgi:hypothetical protein